MNKSKIIVAVRDGIVENVFSNIREDIDIEILYLAQLRTNEELDKEIEIKQNGFREVY